MNNQKTASYYLAAPNLINICIDATCNNEICGRFYHCYDQEPVIFSSILELIKKADILFDTIAFPQSSTKARSFVEHEAPSALKKPSKIVEQRDLIQHNGTLGTFLLFVKFRQNSTWQGELNCLDNEAKYTFSNTLDFIKYVDQAIK